MKAAFIEQYGDAGTLMVGELKAPKISPSQVLINVIAAGVNPVDFHVRNGMLSESGTHDLPLILGWDASGIIQEVGAEVDHLKVGDEVFVHSPIGKQGAYAEYLAVDAQLVSAKPKSLNFVESAAVPLAALTAWQGLLEHGQLKKGQRVLIHNAAGGVGSFAVQIAKTLGAYVIGTASGVKEDYVRNLGSDEFIDYQKIEFEEAVEPVDLVFAAVGGNNILPRSLHVIKPGGHLISCFDEMPESTASQQGITYKRMWVQPSQSDLNKIAHLIDTNAIQVPIDSVYPLEHVQQAHQRSESARAVGKIVLNLNPAVI